MGRNHQLIVAEGEHPLDRDHAIGRGRKFTFSFAANGAIVKRRFSDTENIQVTSPLCRFVNEGCAVDRVEQLRDDQRIATAGCERMVGHVMFDRFAASN